MSTISPSYIQIFFTPKEPVTVVIQTLRKYTAIFQQFATSPSNKRLLILTGLTAVRAFSVSKLNLDIPLETLATTSIATAYVIWYFDIQPDEL